MGGKDAELTSNLRWLGDKASLQNCTDSTDSADSAPLRFLHLPEHCIKVSAGLGCGAFCRTFNMFNVHKEVTAFAVPGTDTYPVIAAKPRKSVDTLVLDWEPLQLCAHGIEIAGQIGLPLAKALDDVGFTIYLLNFHD